MSNPFGPSPNYPYGGPPYGQMPPPYPKPPGPPIYGPPLPSGTVKSWLVESILSLLCCGGLLAIPAVIFAAQVDNHLRQGNYQAAVEASNQAKLWLTIAVGVTLVPTLFCVLPVCVLYVLAAIVAGLGGGAG
jgi:Interferon-induced transmembrane protein